MPDRRRSDNPLRVVPDGLLEQVGELGSFAAHLVHLTNGDPRPIGFGDPKTKGQPNVDRSNRCEIVVDPTEELQVDRIHGVGEQQFVLEFAVGGSGGGDYGDAQSNYSAPSGGGNQQASAKPELLDDEIPF